MNIKIEKLVYGGEGLGHHEGSTVFVPFVLPDEVVRVRPTDRKKKFVRGSVEQVVTPSPARVTPPCPHFGVCGGCHYQHIPYAAQLNYKAEILRETLSRIGRVPWDGTIITHGSPPFAYRNRAQWKVRPPVEGVAAGVGYFQAGSSSLCAVQECPILSPRLAEARAALARAVVEDNRLAALREVEAFADSSDAAVLLNVSLERFDILPAAVGDALRATLPGVETILLHERSHGRFELSGPGFLHYDAAGFRFRVGHLSFFQVNRFLLDELVRAVVAEESGALALDLFAGVGLFTLPLARRFARVVGVESNLAASRDLEANAAASGTAAQHVHSDAEAFLNIWSEKPDLVVLDPPRAGVAPKALARLVALAPPRITYLSCDPATLARDLATLTGGAAEGAYRIHEIHVFDVFPQTFHIESLVRLSRRE